jgi:acetyl esterase/lipase
VPPTLVVVARAERFMPPVLEQGARFVRRLLELGIAADLVIVPGTHMRSIAALGQPGDPTFIAIRTFIEHPVGAVSD